MLRGFSTSPLCPGLHVLAAGCTSELSRFFSSTSLPQDTHHHLLDPTAVGYALSSWVLGSYSCCFLMGSRVPIPGCFTFFTTVWHVFHPTFSGHLLAMNLHMFHHRFWSWTTLRVLSRLKSTQRSPGEGGGKVDLFVWDGVYEFRF